MDVLEMWRLIYQEELPKDIGNVRGLLEDYSSLKADDIDAHLYAIVRAGPSPLPVPSSAYPSLLTPSHI